MSSGIMNSPKAGIKTKKKPGRMAGSVRGSMMARNVWIDEAPKSLDTSRRERSNRSRAEKMGRTIKGR